MARSADIRPATVDDAGGIAIVHVASWQTAYRGVMPDHVLDGLSVESRANGWLQIINDPNATGRTIVADRDGDIVGWASFGPGRDEGTSDEGERWGLYVHPSAFATGVGHALISAAQQALREDGYACADLWVLDGNERAAEFSENHGWNEDGDVKVDERQTMRLLERRRVTSLI